MKKFLLTLIVTMLTCIGAWAQYYKFTAAADGNLYTAKNDASLASTPKGEECKTSYYVKSDHALLEAPLPFTTSQVKVFKDKTYYVESAGNYTSAYQLVYDAVGTNYYTANEASLDFSDDAIKAQYLTTSTELIFNNTHADITNGNLYIVEGSNLIEQVHPGDVFDPSKTYAQVNQYPTIHFTIPESAWNNDWAKTNYLTSKDISAFKDDVPNVVYINDNGVFIPITDNTYTEGTEYFTVVFNQIDDAVKADMASNPGTYFDVNETISGITDGYNVYTYNSVAGTYTKVNIGDTFLPDGKYYKDAVDFVLRTPAELVALGYVNEVSGIVTLEPDGTTLTIACAGDVCDPDDDFESTGYKFQNLEANWLFSDQEGTAVANGDVYNGNPYYTRTPNYVKVNGEDVPKSDKYVVLEDVDVYSYNETNKTYSKIAASTDITSSVILTKDGEEATANLTGKTSNKYIFKGDIRGYLCEVTQHNPARIGYVEWNSEYSETKEYVWLKQQYHNYDINNYDNDPEDDNNDADKRLEDESICSSITFEELNSGGYLDMKTYFIAESGVFKKDGDNYVDVSGTEKPADDTNNYVAGITFNTANNTSASISRHIVAVNTNGVTYYKGDSKTVVVDNEDYEPGTEYFTANGYDYAVKSEQELLDESKLTSITIANNYWEAVVNDINANAYKTVKFVSTDKTQPALICNTVTQAMMYLTSTRVLDMADVAISEINAPFKDIAMANVNQDASGNNLGTFMRGANGCEANNSIETLYTPQVTSANFELKVGAFTSLPKLRYLYLSEGIETLGESSIIANSFHLSQITFPNSLKVIKTKAVASHFNASNHNGLTDLDGNVIPYIETLTLPPFLEVIETAAFAGTCPKDVYFLGRTAPKVARFAWGDDAYISNNAYELNLSAANSGIGVEVHMDKGEASRMNYLAQSGFLAMLHYPADCTPAEAAKYTDPTRNYRRITYNTYSENAGVDPNDPTMTYDGTKYTLYTPGKETEAIKGFGHTTGGAALKAFGNEYPWPSASFTEEAWPQGYYGGDYAGGFYDVTKHEQYLWPSLVMAYRATVVAQNALTWDGVTTIGDVIRAKGESDFEGDGSEYEGLHQFVLAASDGNAESTTEWDMDKYMDGKWHTVCLPFNMTKKQMKETWGPVRLDDDENPVYSIRLCEFSAVERGNDLITLKFNTEKFASAVNDDDIVLKAHISYMIKAEKAPAVDHIKFNRYQIEPGAPKVTEIESKGSKANGKYRFIGNYVKVSAVTGETVKMPKYTYFFSKTTGAFRFQIGTTGVWNPYSSVVEVPKGLDDYESYFTSSTDAGAKVATIYEEDDEATKIDVLMETNGELIYTNSDVFNLNGQKVGNNIEGLPAGIYIVKGKKYLVK